jgi:hypothetical protein
MVLVFSTASFVAPYCDIVAPEFTTIRSSFSLKQPLTVTVRRSKVRKKIMNIEEPEILAILL